MNAPRKAWPYWVTIAAVFVVLIVTSFAANSHHGREIRNDPKYLYPLTAPPPAPPAPWWHPC